MRLGILLLLGLSGLAAQGPVIPVSGRVLTADGQPVGGARVIVMGDRGREVGVAHSHGDGRWSIPDLPSGDLHIRAQKSGYAEVFRQLRVPSSGTLSGIDLHIDRYAVVGGRVTDHRGRPVVGAEPVLFEATSNESGLRFAPAQLQGTTVAETDDRGIFRIWGLAPGRYLVAVAPRGAPTADGVLRLEAAPAFYPGVLSAAEATPIELGWAVVREDLNFRLPPPGDTRVDVRLSISEGFVTALGGGDGATLRMGSAGASANGVARLEGLPPGDYQLIADGTDRREGGSVRVQAVREVHIPEGRPTHVDMLLAAPSPLPGRVVLEDPPESILVEGARPLSVGIDLQSPFLQDIRYLRRSQQTRADIRLTGPQATIEMATLPGRRRMHIQPSGGGYVASVSLDGRPLDSPWLDAPPEGFQGELKIVIRFDVGKIEGRLDTYVPTEGVGLLPPPPMISIEPEYPERSFSPPHPRAVRPDGTFELSLAPGVYRLAAADRRPGQDISWGRIDDPEARSRARRVEVKAGQTTQVTLELK